MNAKKFPFKKFGQKAKLLVAVTLLSTTLLACEQEGLPENNQIPSVDVETQIPEEEDTQDNLLDDFSTDEDTETQIPESTQEAESDTLNPEETQSENLEENSETTDLESDFEEVWDDSQEAPLEEEVVTPEEIPSQEQKIIVIDPGHQAQGNSAQEPIGPGATTTKAKVTSGTTGRFTGVPEYVLNLEVSLKLRDVLVEMGYDVVMIRETHNIDMSNSERAAIANELNADVFIRIHANGDNNAAVEGAFTICPTPANPYCPQIYEKSRLLSELVLDGFIEATGANRRSIWETDTMSGINWCTVPVTIIEMGFMTNEKEDRLMATDDYQNKMAQGMAEGIRRYLDAVDAQ